MVIGDLPEGFDDAGVQTVFGAYGDLKWCKIMQGKGGKINALVEFAALDEAQWFVENLNGNIPEGLTTPIEAKFHSGAQAGKAKGKDSSAGKDAGQAGKAYGGKDFGSKDSGKASYASYGGKGSYGSYGGYGKAEGGKSSKNGQMALPYGGGKSGKDGKGKGKMKALLKGAV